MLAKMERYFQITRQKLAITEIFGEIFPDKSPKVAHHRKFWRDISK
jgi:hypothetical protein